MSPPHGALVVFGSGPGIGRNVASYFAEQGFNEVYLLSRDSARLQEDVAFVKQAAPKTSCEAIEIDLANRHKVKAALRDLDSKLKGRPLECVLYNAARVGTSLLTDWSDEEYEKDLMISVVSMLTVSQWAMPKLVEAAKTEKSTPSFLVTSGGLHKNPFPQFFSLASCKAAQYNLTHSLHKEYGPKGVHSAAIVVEGRVSDEAKVTTARNIAKEAWKLYQQPATGDLDVSIQDPDYLAFIKKTQG
ncbi:unnamed protein product [Zymoseptoria tritici ST99CH_3D7]|uniref:Ketoreductase (KR) domain-containing protein n=1 Tax=Zymoseptoria tritici (strain ST99CH_3D7) TaxID=1276538 RepID=A0A1X7RJ49_ZYMT9|nr:unnamed protein product [Zymoseptoria tritici ST99CH_3D7]